MKNLTSMKSMKAIAMSLLFVSLISIMSYAQAVPPGTVETQSQPAAYFMQAISATAAVNTATTLTIPAPLNSAWSNYVCSLAYELNSDATGAAVSNAVSTSTNFGSFALKVSFPATVSLDSGIQTAFSAGNSGGSCAKSAIAGTATTFVSPASLTHVAFTWYGTFFQAP